MPESAIEQMKKKKIKVFTFIVRCTQESQDDVKYWLRGDKEKVKQAMLLLSRTSKMYAHLDPDKIAETVDSMYKIDILDKEPET